MILGFYLNFDLPAQAGIWILKFFAIKMFTKIKTFFKKLWLVALDTIFPIECLVCKKEGKTICDDCLNKIPTTTRSDCPLCHKMTTTNHRLCSNCQNQNGLTDIIVATDYEQKIIEDLIHGLKYNYLTTNAQALGFILFQKIKILPIFQTSPEQIIIIPVPLHKKRQRERGFNQAELLALELQKFWPIKVENMLTTRQRYTTTQTKLSRSERQTNLKNAFILSSDKDLRNKTVIIVDDVITTGSTILEVANLIKKSGAKIYALTVAQN